MTAHFDQRDKLCANALRRLDELGAVLAIAPVRLAPRAGVLKSSDEGYRCIALVDRRVVVMLAAQGWIDIVHEGRRVVAYTITDEGRAWLKRALEREQRERMARKVAA
jgi:hypothetical protein